MEDQRVNILVDSFKEATSKPLTLENVLLALAIFSFIGVVIFGAYFLRGWLLQVRQKQHFINTAKSLGLTEEEAEILWEYAKKLDRDPYLTLEVKPTFEKVIDEYIKNTPNFKEDMIRHMRKVLGFDVVPPFMPLSSTKDIDLYQGGNLTIEKGVYPVALVDKDELYMYWAILDAKPPIKKGETIKISFLRRDDAIYSFEGTVEDVFEEKGRLVLKIPHTLNLARLQRRKEVRLKVKVPVKVYIKTKDGELLTYETETEDISATGLKFCVPKSEDKLLANLKLSEEIELEVDIKGTKVKTLAVIRNISDKDKYQCYGVEFKELDKKDKAFLNEFIQEKQMELIKQYKQIREKG